MQLETMAGIEQGPHASLDAALAEIEKHTRPSASAILARTGCELLRPPPYPVLRLCQQAR